MNSYQISLVKTTDPGGIFLIAIVCQNMFALLTLDSVVRGVT